MQLIKVSVALEKIEKPLDPPWRNGIVRTLCGIGLLALIVSGFLASEAALAVAAASIPLALIFTQRSWIYLPASARRFRLATRKEHRDLVRRTEAYNRAWCLAERGREYLSSPGGQDPFQAGHDRLRAEVDAYAALYAQAVSADLKRVGIDPDRRAVRQDIVDRAKDLVELEAKLEELGADADPAMRTRARDMREALEKECVKAKLPLGIVRLRRASTAPPVALPTAKVVSG